MPKQLGVIEKEQVRAAISIRLSRISGYEIETSFTGGIPNHTPYSHLNSNLSSRERVVTIYGVRLA